MLDFGDTAPCLMIARHFECDYGAVLRYADFLVHGRGGADLPTLIDLPPEARPYVSLLAKRTREAHATAEQLYEQGRLFFDVTTGKWGERHAP